jgi:hypothetical protein
VSEGGREDETNPLTHTYTHTHTHTHTAHTLAHSPDTIDSLPSRPDKNSAAIALSALSGGTVDRSAASAIGAGTGPSSGCSETEHSTSPNRTRRPLGSEWRSCGRSACHLPPPDGTKVCGGKRGEGVGKERELGREGERVGVGVSGGRAGAARATCRHRKAQRSVCAGDGGRLRVRVGVWEGKTCVAEEGQESMTQVLRVGREAKTLALPRAPPSAAPCSKDPPSESIAISRRDGNR